MKIIVTGAGGLLGPFLLEGLAPLGELVPLTRSECDLGDRVAVRDLVDTVRPTVVVHAAAFTNVDGCERDPKRASVDNVDATRNIADTCPPMTHIIHISTDQVYPDTTGPHREGEIGPVNVYGRTKLEAERLIAQHPRGLVLRTNFFGCSRTLGRKSLSDVIVAALVRRRRFPGFVDALFSPLHATTLTACIASCIDQGLIGTFNMGSAEGQSKAEFARMVARHLGLDDGLVDSTNSSQVPGRAPRPHDLRMDVGSFTAATGRIAPTLEAEVRRL